MNVIDALYASLAAGCPLAAATVRSLVAKVDAGTATPAEQAIVWGLRARSEDGLDRCLKLVEQATRGTMSQSQDDFAMGACGGYPGFVTAGCGGGFGVGRGGHGGGFHGRGGGGGFHGRGGGAIVTSISPGWGGWGWGGFWPWSYTAYPAYAYSAYPAYYPYGYSYYPSYYPLAYPYWR